MSKRLAIALVAFFALPLVPTSAQDFEAVFGNTSDGIKICSVVVDGSWRNDLMVPKSWIQTDCERWATKIGTGVHNLACLLKDRVQYDDAPGWNTCGW